MLLSVIYSMEKHFLYLTILGIYSPHDTSRLIGELNQSVLRNRCQQILINCQMARFNFNQMDVSNYPMIFHVMGFKRSYKTAILVPWINKHFIKFYTICKQNGYNIRLFTEKDSAEEWLIKRSSALKPGKDVKHDSGIH
jgi:hypothetical protein